MRKALLLTGALLIPAALLPGQDLPWTDPVVRDGKFLWFQLTETKQDVARIMGQPAQVASFGRGFRSWQYRIDVADHDDFSHYFVFRESDNRLVSVTRAYDPEQSVAAMFPQQETVVHYYPSKENQQFRALLRRLPAGRVLVAMGASQPNQPVSQVVLLLESELRTFIPWLQLCSPGSPESENVQDDIKRPGECAGPQNHAYRQSQNPGEQ